MTLRHEEVCFLEMGAALLWAFIEEVELERRLLESVFLVVSLLLLQEGCDLLERDAEIREGKQIEFVNTHSLFYCGFTPCLAPPCSILSDSRGLFL